MEKVEINLKSGYYTKLVFSEAQVAALKQLNCWEIFKLRCEEDWMIEEESHADETIVDMEILGDGFVEASFLWSATPEGLYYWYKISEQVVEILDSNV